MPSMIEDGYTADGFIAEAPGLHGALKFKYRPMLPETRDRCQRAMADVAKGHKESREQIKRHLVEWDLKRNDGTDATITVDIIGRLQPLLQDKLYSIVAGNMPSDALPEEVAEKGPSVEESLKN